ncbi:MAG: RDD family protein [Candidatus Hydrogenedentes bacterium]|nr:RDD family protein [Candidatus Hydrogenedentota bacterium]
MPWYYAKDNQRFGPYGEQEFSAMVAQGAIGPDMLVWKDGMPNWQPFREVQSSQQVSPLSPVYDAGMGADGVAMVVCSSCNRTFPEDDVIQYQGAYICAACKPIFQQQLREGATIGRSLDYGGFWIRLGAWIIDYIIMMVFGFLLTIISGGFTLDPVEQQANLGFQIIMNIMAFIVQIAYHTYFVGKFGGTPGKLACGLRIVRENGDKVTYLRAFARFWARALSWFTLGIGFVIAAFDEEKRALHDHVCSTRVIRK